jgi:hypothetical protein
MDWQQLVALAIVAAAFAWLLRTFVFARKKGAGCSGCGHCPTATPRRSARGLVSIETLLAEKPNHQDTK